LFEVYKNAEAKNSHLETPHVRAFLDFNQRGGIQHLEMKEYDAYNIFN
jgi:quinol monooxygenase YgiN